MLGPLQDYLDCPECGTSVLRAPLVMHRCDDRHRRDHLTRVAQDAAAAFEREFRRFLETAEGRFAVYYAERNRPA
jgi:hypothetical protein